MVVTGTSSQTSWKPARKYKPSDMQTQWGTCQYLDSPWTLKDCQHLKKIQKEKWFRLC